MIVLFTDFGLEGPYTGQVKAVLWRDAPEVPVFDLFADAPMQRPKEAAYLLAAYSQGFPKETVFLCVVDPGVGTERPADVHRIDGRWFVGPGNGLFEPVLRRAGAAQSFMISPLHGVSASFHGRDLFAPVAARLARGLSADQADIEPRSPVRQLGWPDDLPAIVYVDRYGNAMTGLRASKLGPGVALRLAGQTVQRSRTFGDVPEGGAFWYENANGLAELAVNRGRADTYFSGVTIGTPVEIVVL
jgi:S-adenosylmethionine hydrolase